jgi:hypothetical protein
MFQELVDNVTNVGVFTESFSGWIRTSPSTLSSSSS